MSYELSLLTPTNQRRNIIHDSILFKALLVIAGFAIELAVLAAAGWLR